MDTGFKAATTIEDAGTWTSLTASQINSSNNVRAVLSWTDFPETFDISDFAFGIPSGATIVGIEVIVEYRSDGGSGGETVRMDVQLSWNNGSSWTTAKLGDDHDTTEIQKTYGGSSDLWGRSWTDGEFADGTFMLRTTANKTGTFPNAEVDYVAVKVYYSTATLEQEGFAFGDDNGNEASHTLETQDTNLTEELDTPRTLRLLIDTDDGSTDNAYKLKYQKNGAGGYVDVPVGASLPGSAGAIESGDVTESGNNTATGSWSVSHPAAADGDLLIFNIGWDDSTTVDGLTAPNGQNGETPITVQDVAASSGTAVRGKIVAYKCNGAWTAGSLTFTPSASEQWTAMVIKVLAGEFDPTTPIGASNNLPSSTTETTPDIPSLTAGASDGGGRVVGMIVGDADDATGNPSGYTQVLARDRGAVGMNLYTRDSLATDSESISLASGATFPTTRAWVSFIYIVRPPADTNNEVFISTSSNVASGGEATTARLAAPSGKTTGDFDTGRRWDDENGSDSVAIGDGEYTELEWIITIQSPGDTDDYYDFRVYKGDAALDTYTVTPRWTIGVGATEAQSTTAGQILAESLTRSTTAGQIDAVSFYTFDTSAGQIFLESHSKATTAGQIVLESAPQYSVTAGQIVIRTRTNKVVLVSPLSGFESTPVTFVWECPDNVDNKAVQFHIQVDNNSDFSSPLHEKKSSVDSGFEYWDGDSWETVPVTGVPSAYYGNDVRIQLTFSVNEVVYWRVRGGAS